MPLIISLSFFKIVLALWATWLWQSRFSKLTCRVGMWIPNPYTRLTFYEGSMTLWAIHQRLWSWNGYLAQTPGTLTTSSLQVIGTKILLKFCAFPTSAYELVHHNFLERGVSNVQHRCGIKSMRGVGTKVPLLWCDGVTWNMYIHTIGWLWMPRSLSQEIRSSSILNTVSIDANMTMSWFQQMGILNNLTFMHMHQNVNEEQMLHGPYMESYGDHNSLSMTCKKLSMNALLAISVSEYRKLAGVVVVMVMGFIEDECTFSTITYCIWTLNFKTALMSIWTSRSECLSIVVPIAALPIRRCFCSIEANQVEIHCLLVCMCMCIVCFKYRLRSVPGDILGTISQILAFPSPTSDLLWVFRFFLISMRYIP